MPQSLCGENSVCVCVCGSWGYSSASEKQVFSAFAIYGKNDVIWKNCQSTQLKLQVSKEVEK